MLQPLKPPALHAHDAVRVLSLASPVQEDLLRKGCEELVHLGYRPKCDRVGVLTRESFFAGSADDRLAAFEEALCDDESRAIFCSRGGYGSNYLLARFRQQVPGPKILLGSSDITSLEIFLWQKHGWVTFYGPMVASNFCHGEGAPHGYDRASLLQALTGTQRGYSFDLQGESLSPDEVEGVLLGGCLTLIETTLGTPWELDTRGAILIVEDRGMKPYQVDRTLMHLEHAGKFREVAGIILGEFPDCEPPSGGETVKDVAWRIFSKLGVPVAWGVPVGHTYRAALTLPLGIRARLVTNGSTRLEILEPACTQ